MSGADDEVYDRVIEMYQSGARLKDITEATGVPRPTIYWALQKRGLRPTRTKTQTEDISAAQVLEQLAAANREIGRLQTLLDEREEEIAKLKERRRKP